MDSYLNEALWEALKEKASKESLSQKKVKAELQGLKQSMLQLQNQVCFKQSDFEKISKKVVALEEFTQKIQKQYEDKKETFDTFLIQMQQVYEEFKKNVRSLGQVIHQEKTLDEKCHELIDDKQVLLEKLSDVLKELESKNQMIEHLRQCITSKKSEHD